MVARAEELGQDCQQRCHIGWVMVVDEPLARVRVNLDVVGPPRAWSGRAPGGLRRNDGLPVSPAQPALRRSLDQVTTAARTAATRRASQGTT